MKCFSNIALAIGAFGARIEVHDHAVAKSSNPLEVCCLCFQEDGEKTNWLIKSYPDDAQADLQGQSFSQCRVNQGDGESDCSAHCKEKGYEMKGCMKGDGMSEWRSIKHWSAKTTAGESSWTCSTDAESDSCACGENSLLEVGQDAFPGIPGNLPIPGAGAPAQETPPLQQWVSGADGQNVCPLGSVRIITEAECQSAAALTKKTYKAWTAAATWKPKSPKGCFSGAYDSPTTVQFNDDAVGIGRKGRKLLCASKWFHLESGKNACPVGYEPITSEAVCKNAAQEIKKTFKPWTAKEEWKAKNPKGCYFGSYGNTNQVAFNDHVTGVPRAGRTVICQIKDAASRV